MTSIPLPRVRAVAIAGVLLVLGLAAPACAQRNDPSREAVPDKSAPSDIDNSRKNAITRAVQACSPAVVGITATEVREYREQDPFFRFFYGDRTYRESVPVLGSGFIISSDGYVLTNHHVAGSASEISVTMTGGEKIPAVLVGSDPVTDIALLKLKNREDVTYLRLGNSDDVIVGEWAIAFGNPFGFFTSSAKPTVTVGVISATHVYLEQREGRVYRNMLQTDAAINSGNSGGPLVNGLGEVIGINTVIYSPNQGSVGLGFAIPINRVKEIVDIIKRDGKVDRTFVPGFRVQTVNSAIARAYKLDKTEGLIVSDIDKRGAASKAGLEVADIIMRANGDPVTSIEQLQGLINYSKVGDVVRLDIVRDRKPMTIDLTLEGR